MRFSCSREGLLGALQIVGSVVSSRGMKPVYESVLVLSRNGGLELQGTDLEVAIRYTLEDPELGIEEAGAFAVPAQRLTSILREVRDEKIHFAWEDHHLQVSCQGSRFRILGLPAEEFPEIPAFPERTVVTLPSGIFSRMVKRTAFATAREKMRYALNGVLLLLREQKLEMVGTDGRRLSYTCGAVDNPNQVEIRAIVPTKGMNQIVKILGEEEESLDLALSERQLAARTRQAMVISRLVEGTFPDFEEVIPVNCEHGATLPREEFVAAVRKASLLTTRESQTVRFSFGREMLALTARAAEVGEAHVEMAIALEGDEAEIAFNPVYVLEGLNAMEGDEVRFEFRNPKSPAKITDGDDFTYVVMPISLE